MFFLAVMMAAHTLQGADVLHLIAGLDLTQTEAAVGHQGKSEFEENRGAVSRLFSNLPAGSRVTAIAVNDRTYATPFVILEARLSADPGYFGSRLTAGRRRLVGEWEKRTKELTPTAPHTDLFGLFEFAAEWFARSDAQRKVLVIFSDMRNDVGLNLERPPKINLKESLAYVEKHSLIVPLGDIEIFIAGAGDHAGSKGTAYTVGLRQFWSEYVRRCDGKLRMFSTTRETAGLAEAVSSAR